MLYSVCVSNCQMKVEQIITEHEWLRKASNGSDKLKIFCYLPTNMLSANAHVLITGPRKNGKLGTDSSSLHLEYRQCAS